MSTPQLELASESVQSLVSQVTEEFTSRYCRSQHIDPAPFDAPELSVLITNSNVQHELAGGEYARRRAQCDSALAVLGQDSWRRVTSEQLAAAKDRLSDEQFRRAGHAPRTRRPCHPSE